MMCKGWGEVLELGEVCLSHGGKVAWETFTRLAKQSSVIRVDAFPLSLSASSATLTEVVGVLSAEDI
jgi:hypothetical protein